MTPEEIEASIASAERLCQGARPTVRTEHLRLLIAVARQLQARVSAMADACDPNSPTHTDPACLTGWRVFSDDLRMYEIMLRGGDPNGAR